MITPEKLKELIAHGESLVCEFKSDRRRISDKEIFEEVVSFANSSGGVLLIGVEDNGTVTGSSPRHGQVTEPIKVQSAIFSNTIPNINTRISLVRQEPGMVLAIEIDPYPEPCTTASGKALRRIMGSDGRPQNVPFYPRDQRSRLTDLGLMDFSARVIDNVSFEDLDPLEFERLRQIVARLRGDRHLLELNDEEIAKALRLVESKDGTLVPNIAGLLLLGREEILQKVLPTHEVRFQVIDSQGNVKANDVFHNSLLHILTEIEARFEARNEERELAIGFFRVPIPDYSPEGFREAFNNALLHRDYNRLDAVYVQWQPDHILITNPGGFPEGITLDNILIHEPKPRNPRLAEALRRIGLVEQTGRGIDKIYMGQLRYGRPSPDYTRSDGNGVRVVLRGGNPSLEFSAFIYEQDKKGTPLSLDEMMVLNALFFERRIDSEQAGKLIQKGQHEGRSILEKLQERGLIDARDEKRGRVYHLSAALYRVLGQKEGYVRSHGISPIRYEAMIMEYVAAHKRIERKQVMELCGLSGSQASQLLKKIKKEGKLKSAGSPPRWVYYIANK